MGMKKVFGFEKRKINLIFYKSAPPERQKLCNKMAGTSGLYYMYFAGMGKLRHLYATMQLLKEAKMKNSILVLIILMVLFLNIEIPAKTPEITRNHNKVYYCADKPLEYSYIKYNCENCKKEVYLIQFKDTERWIIKIEIPNDNSFFYGECTYLKTGESISVKVAPFVDDISLSKITYSSSSNKSFTIEGKELLKGGKVDFVPFIKENFSYSFVSSLLDLRYQVVFLQLGEPLLIMGAINSGLGEFVKLLKESVSSEQQPKLEILPIDCDFDAKFGFPCTKDEVPAKNPKVLVIEKK